jgi:hypothetical protein
MEQIFLSMTTGYPDSPDVAATKFADAYDTYAKGALAGTGTPIFTGSEKNLIKSTLLPVLQNNRAGVLPAYAAAWFNAVLAFWTPVTWAPTVGASGPGVMLVPPAPTITSALSVAMVAFNEGPVWANGQATAIHAGVAGIMTVTFPPIAPGPPIVVPVL